MICSSYFFYPHRAFLFNLFLLFQSCFPIQPISSLLVHPNRVFLFIEFLLCSFIPIVFSYSSYFFILFIPIILSFSSYFFYALHSIYTSKLYFPVSSYAFSYHIFCSFSTSFSHGLSSLLYFPFYTISSNVLSYQSCFPFHSNFSMLFSYQLCFPFHPNFFYAVSSQLYFPFHPISSMLFHINYVFLYILFLLRFPSQSSFPCHLFCSFILIMFFFILSQVTSN